MKGTKYLMLRSTVLSCAYMLANIIIDCTNVIVSEGRDTGAMAHAVDVSRELHQSAKSAMNDYLVAKKVDSLKGDRS